MRAIAGTFLLLFALPACEPSDVQEAASPLLRARHFPVAISQKPPAGITVVPTKGLVTTERGGRATFTMQLASGPSADVVIPLESSNPHEGRIDKTKLLFTPDNWYLPQVVTVSGVADHIIDGTQRYEIVARPAVSLDGLYAGLQAPSIQVVNVDEDVPGVVTAPVTPLVTSEAGAQATFSVRLASRPRSAVTLPVWSNRPSEGIPDTASLTFTPLTWNVPQKVTVTGVDDAVADGNRSYRIELGPAASDDAAYAGQVFAGVELINVDDDKAGIEVSAPVPSSETTRQGGATTFTVRLTSQPLRDVKVPVQSSDERIGLPDTATLTFTSSNWNVPQTVTVTGQPDATGQYIIYVGQAVSADSGYLGLQAPPVELTNVDVTP
jgi:hypothetical protein